MADEIYRARVTRVAVDGVYVEVPEFGLGLEFGPLETVTDTAVLAAGHRVVVSTVGGIPDDLVIVGSLDADPVAGAGGSGSYLHVQDVPAAEWTIVHNLGFYPNVTVVDSADSAVLGDISYPTVNTVIATFGGAFGGRAFLS